MAHRPAMNTLNPTSNSHSKAGSKVLHLMRHGTTEMNVYLRRVPYGSFFFRDPLYYDTRLTNDGVAGAKKAASAVAKLLPKPEVLVVSPLTRAIQTADCAFALYEGPVVVEALARERVYLSSDVGTPKQQLQQQFAGTRYNFDHLDDVWWYNGGHPDHRRIVPEPEDHFTERIQNFKQWLLGRPEAVLAVVAHWGVLYELTGHEFANCEVRSYIMNSADGGELRHVDLSGETEGELASQPSVRA